ncbi:TPA: O-antigen polysaccharide polymerase Wzy [Photobacterium damselae]
MLIRKYTLSIMLLLILSIIIVFSTVSPTLMNLSYHDYAVPLVMLTVLVLALTFIFNNIYYLDIKVLFCFTFVLFVFGRFIASLLIDVDLNYNSFYYDIYISNSILNYNVALCCVFILTFISGCFIGELYPYKKSNKTYDFSKISYALSLSSVALVAPYLQGMVLSYIHGGYLSIYVYSANAGVTKSIYSLGVTCSLMSIFLSCCKYRLNLNKLALLVLIINAFIFLIMGQRGNFFSLVLFFLWLLGAKGKKVNLSLVVIVFCFLVLGSQLLLDFRGQGGGGEGDIYRLIGNFFTQQGITFNFIAISDYVSNWPILPMVQNFIPGSSFLYSLFVDNITPINSQYSHFYSNLLNPQLYQAGYGVGWSIVLDLKILSGNSVLIMILPSMILGGMLGFLIKQSQNENLISGVLVLVAYKIFLLPRSGINSVIPLVIYSLVLFVLLKVLLKIGKRIN